MMTKITAKDLTQIKPNDYVADASELGLAPGQWPEFIDTDLGNLQPLIRDEPRHQTGGALAAFVYKQAFGLIKVTVMND